MGIFSWFQKKQDEEPEDNGLNARDYVEWLLKAMLNNAKSEVIIDNQYPLPGASGFIRGVEPPPCLPPTQLVLNRLKILAGLDPLPTPNPKEGRYERSHQNHTVVITMRFQDAPDRSTCVIRIK